jgi:dTDP-4-dehydrorhamnose 3,5-epimerase
MPDFIKDAPIAGVQIAELRVFGDERGRFMETFRREWFPQVSWDKMQSNRSDSQAGVLRGLHYHFHQVDYWYVPSGRIRAAMVDLRPNSPTFQQSMTLDMGEENNLGLFIPIGVAHGFAALTDCTLTYIVNNYYDASDEFGIAWNDTRYGLDWGVDAPLISERDANNPIFDAIPAEDMPK